jgi:hypothetical protein
MFELYKAVCLAALIIAGLFTVYWWMQIIACKMDGSLDRGMVEFALFLSGICFGLSVALLLCYALPVFAVRF